MSVVVEIWGWLTVIGAFIYSFCYFRSIDRELADSASRTNPSRGLGVNPQRLLDIPSRSCYKVRRRRVAVTHLIGCEN